MAHGLFKGFTVINPMGFEAGIVTVALSPMGIFVWTPPEQSAPFLRSTDCVYIKSAEI